MKTYLAVSTASASVLFTLLLLAPHGTVEDKQAPGTPGEKTFSLLVDNTWRVVPESAWNRCGMYEQFPVCMLSDKPSDADN